MECGWKKDGEEGVARECGNNTTTVFSRTKDGVEEMFFYFWDRFRVFSSFAQNLETAHEMNFCRRSPPGPRRGEVGKRGGGAKVSDGRVHRACLSYMVCLRPALA
jgi:hypothetical protein